MVECWVIIKNIYATFVLILVPIYWYHYTAQNFLWVSDIGLFLTLVALWMNSLLLMSVAALQTMVLELLWMVDFLSLIIWRATKLQLAAYMFDQRYSVPLRLLSLFHLVNPVVWLLYLKHYGYDCSAIYYTIPFFIIIILVSYLITDVPKNINWVFLPTIYHFNIRQHVWLTCLIIAVPLVIILPTHVVFLQIFNVKCEGLFRHDPEYQGNRS